MLAEKNTAIAEVAQTMYRLSEDDLVRERCQSRQDHYREILSMQKEIEKGKLEFAENEKQLAESEKQLAENKKQLAERVSGLVAEGKSVSVQKAVPEKLRYKEKVSM